MEANIERLDLLDEFVQFLLRVNGEFYEKSNFVIGDIYLEEIWFGCHHKDYVFHSVWANEWVQFFSIKIFKDVLWFEKTIICQRFWLVDSNFEGISYNDWVIV